MDYSHAKLCFITVSLEKSLLLTVINFHIYAILKYQPCLKMATKCVSNMFIA